MKRYLKQFTKLESCKSDSFESETISTENFVHNFSHKSGRIAYSEPCHESFFRRTVTSNTSCPTIAKALWRPLWPPGWYPRGSFFNSRVNTLSKDLSKTVINMSREESSSHQESPLDFISLEEKERMEAWLDEHPAFFNDYVVRKANRNTIDAWLLAHTVSHSSCLSSSTSSASASGSGVSTPIRRISAHEFEKGTLILRPIVSATEDGNSTFLSAIENEIAEKEPILICPTKKTRIELEQLDEKQLIFELVKDICNDLDVVSLNHKILKNVSILTNADRCSLFMVKGDKYDSNRHFVSTLFDVSSDSHVEEMKKIGTIKIPWGEGIVGHVAETGKSVIISDCYSDNRFSSHVDQITGYKTKNLLCSPILDSMGEVIGVAQVINKLPSPSASSQESSTCFTLNDQKIFNQYLQFCGIGLRNAQHFERSQLENRRNQVLLDLAKMVFEDQSTIEQIVYRIMENIQSLLECERCQVLLLNENNTSGSDALKTFNRVFELEANDFKSEKTQGQLLPHEGWFEINFGITGHVAATGEILNIPNVQEDPRFNPNVHANSSHFKHRSILCMPIKNSNHKIIGVVQLINKINGTPFNKNDENIFEAFSIFIGLGIHNTQMYENAIKAMAKQSVTLECLSYHATAKLEEAQELANSIIPSTSALLLDDLNFNDFSLTDDETLLHACIRMFLDLDLINRFQIDYNTLCRWLLSVRKNYRPNTYHNWRHAFNVTQMMFAILVKTQLCTMFGPLETLALIIACLCHDLDHRGTNNSFQVKTSSPLATLYSTSTLEHHHFDQSLMIINSEGNQILSNLSPDDYKIVIRTMEDAILATDLALYFQNREQFTNLIQTQECDWLQNEERKLLRSMLMTACDIAAITKPWEVQKIVACLVAMEFFQQGDIEKATLNVQPVDMMNREKKDQLPKLQVEFIDSICQPLYSGFSKLFPKCMKAMEERMNENRKHWLELALEQKTLKEWALSELAKMQAE